ncbi:hypothetical protein K402DRAFT_417705 [Aulographum hederae CBS 113979]|uniref:Uncharacterized protein n=1 Tax=Aulographum hederae CBS 113979 TaxID=1176131 RepID=A0A6G1HAK6_9PEZI|nr:hypothetical protein K402DRAFT_417705 [Aulographum hederae CBS 113979]
MAPKSKTKVIENPTKTRLKPSKNPLSSNSVTQTKAAAGEMSFEVPTKESSRRKKAVVKINSAMTPSPFLDEKTMEKIIASRKASLSAS